MGETSRTFEEFDHTTLHLSTNENDFL